MFGKGRVRRRSSEEKPVDWCKFFKVSPDEKPHPSEKFPDAAAIFENLPKETYKKKKIKKIKAEFLKELFEKPGLMEAYYELFRFLSSKLDLVAENSHAFDCVSVHMARALIIYTEAFEHLFPENVTDKLLDGLIIFKVLIACPRGTVLSAEGMMNAVFDRVCEVTASDAFETVPGVQAYVGKMTEFLVETMQQRTTNCVTLQATQVVIGYGHRKADLTRPGFTKEELVKMVSIVHCLLDIDVETCVTYFQEIPVQVSTLLYQIVSATVNFRGDWPIDVYEVYRFASYCFVGVIDLSKKIAQLGSALNDKGFIEIFAKFVYWTADLFPVLKIQSETKTFDSFEMMTISPEWIERLNVRIPPVMEFTRRTFPQDLGFMETKTQFANEMPKDELKYVDYFKSVQQLFKMVRLFDEENHTFVSALMKNMVELVYFDAPEEKVCLRAMRLYVLLCFLNSVPLSIRSAVSAEMGLIGQLVKSFVFKPEYSFVTIKEQTDDLLLFKALRNAILSFFASIFQEQPVTMLDSLAVIIDEGHGQVVDQILAMLELCRQQDKLLLAKSLLKSKITVTLSRYDVKLQSSHLYFLEHNNKDWIEVYLRYRKRMIGFIVALLGDGETAPYAYCCEFIVAGLFHHLYECSMMQWSLDAIRTGIRLQLSGPVGDSTPCQTILPFLCSCLKTCLDSGDGKEPLSLLNGLLVVLTDGLKANQKELISLSERWQLWKSVSHLPWKIWEDPTTNRDMKLHGLNLFIYMVSALARDHNENIHHALLSDTDCYLDRFAKLLSTIEYGEETVNALLTLLLEQEVSFRQLPSFVELKFYKALPFIHFASKHLSCHAKIFQFVKKMCVHSFANTLHVFETPMQSVCLQYIMQFPDRATVSNINLQSITALLELYQLVSERLFKPDTFNVMVTLLRQTTGEQSDLRPWYVSKILQSIDDILAKQTTELPSSFFHFEGTNSGLIIPQLSFKDNQKAMTYICRFQLDETMKADVKDSRFLVIESKSGRMELVFADEKKMDIVMSSKAKGPIVEKLKYDFMPNEWYTFALSITGSDCVIYVNSDKAASFSFKNSDFRLSATIDKFNVCTDIDAPEGSSLPCNMSCVYIFNSALPKAQIKSIAGLPLNYIHSFLPSNKGLCPQAPSSLFTGDLEAALMCCYNARMTDNNTNRCSNLKTKSVGSATLKGHVVPFSATFYGAATIMGGLANLIPVFDQIERRPIAKDDLNTKQFFDLFLHIFGAFNRVSEDIEVDFCKRMGIKALVHSLSKVSPDTFTEQSIIRLREYHDSLRSNRNRKEMISILWINRNLWAAMSAETQQALANHLLGVYARDTLLFEKVMPFPQFLAMLTCIEDNRVRQGYFNILVLYGKHTFPKSDQKVLYQFGQRTYVNPTIQVQALDALYRLMSDRIGDSHLMLLNHKKYSSMISLAMSPVEEVRLMSIKYVLLADSLHARGFLSAVPMALLQSIQMIIKSWNPENSSDAGWMNLRNYIIPAEKEENAESNISKTASQMLQLVCSVSCHHSVELIRKFFVDLKDALMNDPIGCEMIRSAYSWDTSLLFCASQLHVPLDSNECAAVHEVYASIFVQTLIKEKPKVFGATLGKLQWLELCTQWKMIPFIRCCLMKMMKRKDARKPNIVPALVFFTMAYMFCVCTWETYVQNLQLAKGYGLLPTDPKTAPTPLDPPYKEYCDMLAKPAPATAQFSPSTRFEPNGRWVDAPLALSLSQMIDEISPVPENWTMTYNNQTFRVMDLATMNECYLVRSGAKNVRLSLETIWHSLSTYAYESALLSMSLFTYFLNSRRELRGALHDMISRSRKSFGRQKLYESESVLLSLLQISGPKVAEYILTVQSLVPKLRKMSNKAYTKMADLATEYLKVPDATKPALDVQLTNDLITQYIQTLPHMRGVCAKSFTTLKRDITSNIGSWQSRGPITHWQLSKQLDSRYRHLIMKPNNHFDVHKMASLLRDTNDKERAGKEYEMWRQTQVDVEIEEAHEDEDEAADESRPAYSFKTEALMISVKGTFKGVLSMNSEEIFFDGKNEEDEKCVKTVQILLKVVTHVFQRNFLHIPSAIELFTVTPSSYFFFFPKMNRRKVIRFLNKQSMPSLKMLQTGSAASAFQEAKITEKWLSGQLSNYEYIMYVNMFAGRSFNDLSQYPVFPWVLADYTSTELNLDDPKTFRDLSRPIGTLNEARLEKLKIMSAEDEESNHALYRMHYSNGYYVCHYMIRVEPFTSLHIKSQNGQFDHCSRMFFSIPGAWKSVTGASSDYRELIPELFTTPQILTNNDGFDLGPYGNVELPAWAKSPEDFVSKHMQALESPYVTENLHNWIDLIFGYKQSGKEAAAACNTFHPYFYPSSVTKDVLKKKDQLSHIQSFAMNFGIIPNEIFSSAHPAHPPCKSRLPKDLLPCVFEKSFNTSAEPVYLAADDSGVLTVTANAQIEIFTKKEKTIVSDLSTSIANRETKSDTVLYLQKPHIFIASSACDSSFHSYKVDSGGTKPLASIQRSSLVQSICASGDSTFILTSMDTSLTRWKVSTEALELKYRITPHSVSLATSCNSRILNMLVSADKQGNVVMSHLSDGRYMYHFTVHDQITRMMVTRTPALVLACTNEEGIQKIYTYSLNNGKYSEVQLNSPIRAWCEVALGSCQALLVVALSDKSINFYELPSLKLAFSTKLEANANSMAYDEQKSVLWVATCSNVVYSTGLHTTP